MRKLNTLHSLGLVFISAFLFSNHIKFMPEMLKGIFAGAGITLTLLGNFAYKHDISKLRNYKINLFKRFFRQST